MTKTHTRGWGVGGAQTSDLQEWYIWNLTSRQILDVSERRNRPDPPLSCTSLCQPLSSSPYHWGLSGNSISCAATQSFEQLPHYSRSRRTVGNYVQDYTASILSIADDKSTMFCVLIKVLSRNVPGGTEEKPGKTLVKIVGVGKPGGTTWEHVWH
jgi:hypothetical protein